MQSPSHTMAKPEQLSKLEQLKNSGEKIAMLTCYDAAYAKLSAAAGVDVLLVGDSLGMVLQGSDNTLNVSMQDMLYHTRCVAAGAPDTLIIADMPAGSYESDFETAYRNAQALIQAGAHIIKLEGGGNMINIVRHLIHSGITVCAHLGFTPQSVLQLGGYKIQGKTDASAQQILQDAIAMSEAGAAMLVLEMVPASLAKQITESINTPTIGIGAGIDCSGQVLVLQDLLGIYTGPASKAPADYKAPRFAKNFLCETNSVQQAVANYVQAVKNKTFPAIKHSY